MSPASRRGRILVVAGVVAVVLSAASLAFLMRPAPSFSESAMPGYYAVERYLWPIVGRWGLELRYGPPTGRYMIPQQDDAESQRLGVELGQVRYVVWPAIDSSGQEVMLARVAQVASGATATVPPAFTRDFEDGVSSLESMDRLLKSFASEGLGDRGIRSSDLLVPVYLWELPDGSGFFVVDYTELTLSERRRMTDNGMEQSFDYEYWPASRITTMSADDFEANQFY